MIVTDVSLRDFRNYEAAAAALSPGVNILRGLNAQGKTNFTEALYFCGTGRSYRTTSQRELVRFGQEAAWLRAEISRGNVADRIDVTVQRDGGKAVAVNGLTAGKLGDLFGVLYAVVFSPEDLRLVKAGPAERRRFMDMELCQLDAVYYYDLRRYYRVLRQRNGLLKTLRHEGRDGHGRAALAVWDAQLVEYGGRVVNSRAAFVRRLNDIARETHAAVTGGAEELALCYRPSVSGADFAGKLARNMERDIYMGATTAGAHKDDLVFTINGQDARAFGSQGQQRTAALSLKLAELALIQREKRENPVLLLDDVFSELDAARQARLLDSLGGVQAVITCTGAEGILAGETAARRFTVENGAIISNI